MPTPEGIKKLSCPLEIVSFNMTKRVRQCLWQVTHIEFCYSSFVEFKSLFEQVMSHDTCTTNLLPQPRLLPSAEMAAPSCFPGGKSWSFALLLNTEPQRSPSALWQHVDPDSFVLRKCSQQPTALTLLCHCTAMFRQNRKQLFIRIWGFN